MKRLSIPIRGACIVAALSLLPCQAMAQENVKKAFNEFLSSKITINLKLSSRKDPATGRLVSQCNLYDFVAPESKRDLIDKICNAFEKDRDVAYWSLIQGAHSSKQEVWNLLYGDDPNNYITVGDKEGYSVVAMNVLDGKDHRYSYAMEWRDQPYNSVITGTLMILYGKMPNQKTTYSFPNTGDSIVSWSVDVGDKYNDRLEMNGKDSITWNVNGKKYSIPYSGKLDQSTISAIASKQDSIFRLIRPYLGNDSLVDQTLIMNHIGNTASSTSTEIWLSMFNNLRSMFNDNSSPSMRSSIVPQIVSLCRKADGKLTKREKKLCTESILDMKKQTKDKFQLGLLDEALDYLK